MRGGGDGRGGHRARAPRRMRRARARAPRAPSGCAPKSGGRRCRGRCTDSRRSSASAWGSRRRRAQLLKERDQFGEGAVIGPLSDFVSTGAASAQAVERFLGNTVHAILVRDRARRGLDPRVARARESRVRCCCCRWMRPLTRTVGIAERCADLVEAADPAKSWIRTLLGQVQAGGERHRVRRRTRRGVASGLRAGSRAAPPSRRARRGARRRSRARRLRARDSCARPTKRARTLQRAEAEVAKAIEASSAAQQGMRRAAEQRDEIERRRQRAAREVEQLDVQHERVHVRQQELVARLAELESRRADSAVALERAEAELAATGAQLGELQRAQELARDERGSAQVIEAQVLARLQNASDRERRLEAEVATAELAAAGARRRSSRTSRRRIASSRSTWPRGAWISTRARPRSPMRSAALDDAERAVHDADTALLEVEHAGDAAHQRAHSLAESLHHAELRFTELSGRRTAIRERLEAEWRRPLEEMLAAVPASDVDEPVLRAEVAQLRAELESIGPVNALAIEEHEEESKRLDFLTTQRADLIEAKNSLHQAIKEIDITARELFLATFSQVREHFRQIFMTLFGGGDCDLRLENPDTPLDCDIEIHASPRGKLHAAHPSALERRARARRALAAVRNLPHEAESVLPARRGGCAAGRSEHRPLRAHAQPLQGARRSSSSSRTIRARPPRRRMRCTA